MNLDNYKCDNQMNIFDFINQEKTPLKIKKPIRLIELFGGVGSQSMALRDLGADYVAWKLVEYDKFPIASYNAIFGTDFKPTDITKIHAEDLEIVNREQYTYLMTYSFPCQDVSCAGYGKSLSKENQMNEETRTRSGLLWEVERLLNECGNELPQILVMENVKNLLSKKHKVHFDEWCKFLESKGYTNFYDVLDLRNFGIPQSRQRVFMVSVLGNYSYDFPKAIPLDKCLRDYLESSVDDSWYLTSDNAKRLIDKLLSEKKLFDTNKYSDVRYLGFIDKGTGIHQSNMVVDSSGIAQCIDASYWKQPSKVVEWIKL